MFSIKVYRLYLEMNVQNVVHGLKTPYLVLSRIDIFNTL